MPMISLPANFGFDDLIALALDASLTPGHRSTPSLPPYHPSLTTPYHYFLLFPPLDISSTSEVKIRHFCRF